MNTAVQLRESGEGTRRVLLWGAPSEVRPGHLGPIALFRADEIVAYILHWRNPSRLFVFRTLAVDDPFAASVPGVWPHVRLLLMSGGAERIRRVRTLFRYVVKSGRCPSRLPDDRFIRLSVALGGRRLIQESLTSLVATEE